MSSDAIKNIMHNPTFVSPTDNIEEVCRIMAKKNVGSVIVGSKDDAQGMFTERDVSFKIVALGVDPKTTKVEEYMTSPVTSIDSGSSISSAQTIFSEKKIRRLPVVDNGIIVGIVSARSVLNNINFDSIKNKYYDSLHPSRF